MTLRASSTFGATARNFPSEVLLLGPAGRFDNRPWPDQQLPVGSGCSLRSCGQCRRARAKVASRVLGDGFAAAKSFSAPHSAERPALHRSPCAVPGGSTAGIFRPDIVL